MLRVSIIIPVYNAFSDTIECLESILSYGGFYKIILIDDCSTEGIFTYRHEKIEIYRNKTNLGFVGSINFGMSLVKSEDFIILNSDTIVSKDWIENLKLAAYSRHNVATVTPLSNNATICSFPNFNEDNQPIKNLELNILNNQFNDKSDNDYVIAPTCVGFCTYIRNKAFKTIGKFDEKTFGKGYGEENDFSRRAVKLGFINLIDHKTYIIHKGSLSFNDTKKALLEANHQKLINKHPEYAAVTNQFIQDDPLFNKRIKVSNKIFNLINKKYPLTLHILHNGPYKEISGHFGGTEIHVRDLINTVNNIIHATLVVGKNNYHVSFTFESNVLEYKIPRSEYSVRDLIAKINPDTIHAHNAGLIDIKDYREIMINNNSIISLHDFNAICPVSQLFRPDNKTCNLNECSTICGFRDREITVRRETANRILKNTNKILYFSESTKDLFSKALNINEDLNWYKIRHPVANTRKEKPVRTDKKLKILLLGIITPQKGYYQISELLELSKNKTEEISWQLLGKINFKHKLLKNCGSYDRKDVINKIHSINPDVVLIASMWPETYCMTLDEAWSAGIPVIATPIGAPAERISTFGGGLLTKDCSTQSIFETINSLAQDPQLLATLTEQIKNIPLKTFNDSSAEYFNLYNTPEIKEKDLNFIKKYLTLNRRKKTIKEIISSYIKFKIIFLLDYFGIKAKVKAFMTKYSLLDYLR